MRKEWGQVLHPSLFRSTRTDWLTPGWFIDLVNEVGPIALDPATNKNNPTGARNIYTGDPHNGLLSSWDTDGLVFCNPPYGKELSRAGGWSDKMATYEGEALYLVPSRTETRWWRSMYSWCDWALLWSSPTKGSRIRFVDGESGLEMPKSTFPSTVFYKGPRVSAFIRGFAPHGTLLPGASTQAALIRASAGAL